jgi:hypothetical protein
VSLAPSFKIKRILIEILPGSILKLDINVEPSLV